LKHGFSYHYYLNDTYFYLLFQLDDLTVDANISAKLIKNSCWIELP